MDNRALIYSFLKAYAEIRVAIIHCYWLRGQQWVSKPQSLNLQCNDQNLKPFANKKLIFNY